MSTWLVSDVMSKDVATVREDTPYREIIDVVTSRHISGVPVVDYFGHVLGVVSEADLMLKVELIGEPDGRRMFESPRRRHARVKADAAVASELMTSPAVTALPDDTVTAAARVMDSAHVKRLPVVDDLGRVVGIITRGDLLKVHLRPDAGIRSDVVHEILCHVLAVQDGTVRVSVCDGVVTLVGRLDRRTTAAAAVHMAGQVSGVVKVVDQLEYEYDDTFLAGLDATLAPFARM